MKRIKRVFKHVAFIALLFLSIKCSQEDPGPIKPTISINDFFRSIPDWEIEEIEVKEDSLIGQVAVKDQNTDESYNCDVFQRNLVTKITDFVSVGTNEGVIWPGALIQGNSLKTGDLKLISAVSKRAPITIITNLTLDNISATIDPNSVNANQAISDFMIAAGNMPEGSQSAGTMNFLVEEAFTFEQSMRKMGISAGFTEPQYKAGLEGSLNVKNERSSKSHTVVAKFVQEMFTVRIADDLIQSPADFFADDFKDEDLESLKNSGEIGESNIPIYIESVTYGRILLFSSTSDNVSSSNELALALEGSMADYAKMGGEYNQDQEEIMSNSRHRIFSAGGTDKAANDVIGKLDWSKFFVESPASTAVPISFTARTVNGEKLVGMVFNNSLECRDECSLVEPEDPNSLNYKVIVEWTNTDNTGLCIGSGFGTCSPNAYVKIGKETSFVPLTAINGYKREFIINADDNNKAFTVRSFTRLKMPWPYSGFTTKTDQSTYSPVSLPQTKTFEHKLSNFAGSVTFTYRITTTKIE